MQHGALCWSLVVLLGSAAAGAESRCERITLPLCKTVGYNFTRMPNQLKHSTQEEAGLEAHQFWPLVSIRCSADLRFFLCSLYTPICLEDYDDPLPPCRSVCERARAGCAPLMRQYGFPWPERMRCELLPDQSERHTLCLDHNHSTTAPPPLKPTGRALRPHTAKKKKKHRSEACESGCFCRTPLVRSPQQHVHTGHAPDCALPCHSPYLSLQQRAFTVLWLGLWSLLCCVCTLVTVVTFLMRRERVPYPERPIVFMAACHLCVSLGFLLRLAAGHEHVACDGDIIRYGSTGPALCTLVFLLTYFFSMASALWWVILSLTWFLAAALKWSSEAMAARAEYFHLVAWLVPSVKCIAVLALSAVDGDSVAGVCSVGNQNVYHLRGFVLAPLVLYLLVGGMLVLAGFVSLFRIRTVMKRGGAETQALERLILRIGVFTALYALPAAVTVACHMYEHQHRRAWEEALTCSCAQGGAQLRYAAFMLKYLMSLSAGISTGAWLWSLKTVDMWSSVCTQSCWKGKDRAQLEQLLSQPCRPVSAALTSDLRL
uniref:Uncharacterized protein n=1 Tax=Knipowitschia caucasica TaxID=637954 RepID=A0AAV2K033_KNICA